jgi:hypothetical protein
MRVGTLATFCVVVLLVGSSCGPQCTCSPYPFYSAVFLTGADSNKVVPLGFGQYLGVLLPGSGRTIEGSDGVRLIPYLPTVDQPDDMTFEQFWPGATMNTGTFGGTVTLSSRAQPARAVGRSLPAWHLTVVIGSDPRGEFNQGTYSGRGTTTMVTGQSFVVSWPVGGAAPTTSDVSVLAPVGPITTVHSAYQPGGQTTFSVIKTFTQQLFVATGVGRAKLNAPDAMPPGCNASPEPACSTGRVGPSQDFVVRNDPTWTCSVRHGCIHDSANGYWHPDWYQRADPSDPVVMP